MLTNRNVGLYYRKTLIKNLKSIRFFSDVYSEDKISKRFAVIGSGPAGFYTTKMILRRFEDARVDIFEQLPHPFGLLRTGVAPDHQEMKVAQNDFNSLIEDNRVNIFCNVRVVDSPTYESTLKQVEMNKLLKFYSSIIIAYGAESEYTLGLSNLEKVKDSGIFSSREFVNWYNGHVEYTTQSSANKIDYSKARSVLIVGNGNVAIDIARILSRDYKELRKFDIPEHVLDKLKDRAVEEIHIIGRRGAIQSAFTTKEIRELSAICDIYVLKEELLDSQNEESLDELHSKNPADRRQLTRKFNLIQSFNIIENLSEINSLKSSKPRVFLRYLLTPISIETPNGSLYTSIKTVKLVKNTLSGKAFFQKASPIKESIQEINCNLIFTSIGYKPIRKFSNFNFNDSLNTIKHKHGIVYDSDDNLTSNVFTCGWIKRGAKGIIDSTLRDCEETFSSIVGNYDYLESKPLVPYGILLNDSQYESCYDIVDKYKWKRIQSHEIETGKRLEKLYEKIITRDEMLDVANRKI